MEKKSSIGAKHVCESCGTKFYDMGKEDPICPKCGWSQSSGQSDISEFDDEDMLHNGEDGDSSEDNYSEDFDKAAEADAFSGSNFGDDDDDDDDGDDELAGTDTDQIIENDDSDDDDSDVY